MVAWSRVTRPVELGGLGVLDLETLGYALRLQWSWLARVDPARISSLPVVGAASNKEDTIIKAMFQASTSVHIGNGVRTLSWSDPRISGSSVASIAPDVFTVVPKRVQRTRLVADGLTNNTWVSDVSGSLFVAALAQYVSLWSRVAGVQLNPLCDDKFIWKWTANQQYLASSAY
jgi:hypothetical protein